MSAEAKVMMRALARIPVPMNVTALWLTVCAVSTAFLPNEAAADGAPDSELAAMAQSPYRFDPGTAGISLIPRENDEAALGMIADPETEAAASQPAAYGLDGSRYWMVRSGIGVNSDGDDVAIIGIGLMYFIADDLSLNIELNGAGFQQDGDDAAGIDLGLMLRWHFYSNEARTFSVYGEGGAGIMYTSADVPQDSSSFNFTPQLGAGISCNLSDPVRLDVGVRWFHVSNANLYESNPGLNYAMVYAELCLPF